MGYKTALPPGSLEADVAAHLRYTLALQGHSWRWLAVQAGLPHVTVARWLRGDTAPGLGDLDRLCAAMGTTLVRLLLEVTHTRRATARQPQLAAAG